MMPHAMVRRWGPRRGPVAPRGVAAVEFAVCLPVIVTIVFASIEACSMVFLKQAIQVAAYESARVAVAINGTADAAVGRGNAMLSQRAVQGGSVEVTPADIPSAAPGTQVTVTVRAPIDANRLVPRWFFPSGDLSVNCVMLKEGNSQ